MKENLMRSHLRALAVCGIVLFWASAALANGTETLGPAVDGGGAPIAIAEGNGVIVAGTGLRFAQPGTIDINVPGQVNQVLLYWDGQMGTNVAGDDTIVIEGIEVTGTLIGGPTFFFNLASRPPPAYGSAFRADITDLDLVNPGANSLTVEGLDFTRLVNGAGVLVIFDDGVGEVGPVGLRDGIDFAFFSFPAPRRDTIPQTFDFDPDGADRSANLGMFFSSVVVGDGPLRPNSIEVTTGGVTTIFSNLLSSVDGPEYDAVNLELTIPAGAGSLTVQAFSRDDGVVGDPATGEQPSSLTWTAAALSIFDEPEDQGITRTLGYWKNHPTVIDGSFDGDGGFPSLLPLSFCGESILEACDAVEFLSLGGGDLDNFKRQGMAALLNCQAFGCSSEIANLIQAGSEACGTSTAFDFGDAGYILDTFNMSGDEEDLPFDSPSALPRFCR
jgi:hypothetical protein